MITQRWNYALSLYWILLTESGCIVRVWPFDIWIICVICVICNKFNTISSRVFSSELLNKTVLDGVGRDGMMGLDGIGWDGIGYILRSAWLIVQIAVVLSVALPSHCTPALDAMCILSALWCDTNTDDNSTVETYDIVAWRLIVATALISLLLCIQKCNTSYMKWSMPSSIITSGCQLV